jgi:hypothetical protein
VLGIGLHGKRIVSGMGGQSCRQWLLFPSKLGVVDKFVFAPATDADAWVETETISA